MYKNSEDIKVYPTSKRKDIFSRHDRLNTEKNLINIVNRLTGQKSFIISGLNVTSNTTILPGECNIGGYYINLLTNTLISEIEGSGDTIYLEIYKNTENGFVELSGIDDEYNKYTGLAFKRGSNITLTETTLPILYLNGATWENIETSRLAFNLNQIQVNSGVLNSTKDTSLEEVLENVIEIDDGTL